MTTLFFDKLAKLDHFISRGPSASDFKRDVEPLLTDDASVDYFYGELKDPRWLEVLRDAGRFREPPEPVRDPEIPSVAFPPWPASRYLARMASLGITDIQQLAVEIAQEIPDTDNTRVHEDLADVALAVPADQAAMLVSKAKAWLECESLLLLPPKLGQLVSRLVQNNRTKEALDLARWLLAVLPDPKTDEKLDQEGEFAPSLEPRARFDLWTYEQILKNEVPKLLGAAGLRALSLLCDLLEAAVRFAARDPESDSPKDGSYIWRPAIEEHSQNAEIAELRDLLVRAVRDGAQHLAEGDSERLPKIIELLEERNWLVFVRIALHLLSNSANAGVDLVAARLTNRDLFNEVGVRHEYDLLLEESFARVEQEDRDQILGWIDAGPDRKRFMGASPLWTGKPATEEDYELYKPVWQRDRLAPMGGVLAGQWKERYEKLVEEVGPPRHPDFPFYTSAGFETPKSPKSPEELETMSVAEVAGFLSSWRAGDRWEEPSPSGLASEVRALAAKDPERYASDAGQFEGLDPTYVRALVQGLNDALRQKLGLTWPPVLALCSSCVRQNREIPGRTRESRDFRDLDPDWGWARAAIADLINEGLKEELAEIPFDLRTETWDVLEPLTEDPEPAGEDEGTSRGLERDPATVSINTVRGKAMHAVVRYALWVKRHAEREEGQDAGFDSMPDVRRVLDDRLQRDRSTAIRAVYGQWFPWLVSLDAEWAKEAVPKIFPVDQAQRNLRDAAWETYVIFCQPYDNVFNVVREEYARAVERIGTAEKEGDRLADPEERLAEHLMALYWRGKIELHEPGGLLSIFYEKAGISLRTHALHFVGWALHGTDETIPSGTPSSGSALSGSSA